MANSIFIEVEIDDSGAVKSLGNIEKKSKESGQKISKNVEGPIDEVLGKFTKKINPIIAGFAAAAAGAAVFAKGIQAATVQEQAVERLNQQLKLTGEFTSQSSQDLQEYATSLQKISEFGDEVIIDNIALAKSFGATNEQAKQIASTAIDLAKSFNISLESATRNAAKTLGGYAGELGEVIPELKDLTKEQLQAGAGIDLLSRRFNGAGKNLEAYGFVASQASNAFGDFLEEIGKFVTENDSFIEAIKDSIKFTNDFAAGLKGIRIALGIVKAPTDELGKLDKSIAENIDKVNMLRDSLKDLQDGNLFGFVTVSDQASIDNIIPRIEKLDAVIADQVKRRKELVKTTLEGNSAASASDEARKQKILTDAQLISAIGVQTEERIKAASLARINAVNDALQRNVIGEQEASFAKLEIKRQEEEQLAAIEQASKERQIESNQSIAEAVRNSVEQQQTSYVALGKSLTQLSVQGFGNAFANIGRALASGGNAAQAFTDTIKATFGDLAGAIGDFYIKRGIAQTVAGDPGGPAVIAAGAALKVLGGFLGGGATAGAGGGAVATESVGSQSVAESEPVALAEPQEEGAVNQIIVQGDVFDSEETGLRIFDIISQQSEKNGNVIIGGSFA